MFFSDWFYRILAYLGLRQKEKRTLLLALPCDFRQILGLLLGVEVPTHPASVERSIENVKFKVSELVGTERSVRVLRDYYHVTLGAGMHLVVADADSWLANDEEMLAATREELEAHVDMYFSLGVDYFFLKIDMFAESKEKRTVSSLFNFLRPRRPLGLLDAQVLMVMDLISFFEDG